MNGTSRLEQAFARFDAANAADPNLEVFDGVIYPAALLYAQRMSAMLQRFAPGASEAVRLAARSQHICRWMIPRDSYSMDREGYKRWRIALYKFHGEIAGGIMREVGYGEEMIATVQALLRKEKLKANPETQLLEDVIDLVFLQYYMAGFVAKYSHYDEEKMLGILRKTWKKMSGQGHEAALKLDFTPQLLALVNKALAGA